MLSLSWNARRAMALFCIAFSTTSCSAQPHFDGTTVHKVAPTFTLTDQYGKQFNLTDQRGYEVVLFFGYTHCPDVCPATMATLAQAVNRLTPAERQRVRIAFVTVDPDRDGPAMLGRYVRLFNPSFYGLTGTERELDPVYRAYRVFHQKLPGTKATGYLVAHGSTIYLIDPRGDERVLHEWSDSVDAIAHDMKELVS